MTNSSIPPGSLSAIPSEDLRAAFGGWMRLRRESHGLSQGELADKLGCRRVNVSQWENGRCSPSPGFLQKLYDLFGSFSLEVMRGRKVWKRGTTFVVIKSITNRTELLKFYEDVIARERRDSRRIRLWHLWEEIAEEAGYIHLTEEDFADPSSPRTRKVLSIMARHLPPSRGMILKIYCPPDELSRAYEDLLAVEPSEQRRQVVRELLDEVDATRVLLDNPPRA